MKSTNVYTVMLMLSLLFITTASVFLIMELSRFGGGFSPWNTASARPTIPAN